jgi:hypothetical protein
MDKPVSFKQLIMKALIKISIGITFIILLFACNKDEGPFISGGIDVSEIDTVSYSTHIQPIFDANCISCHNASHAKLDLQQAISYDQLLTDGFSASYVDTANPAQSNLYLHLTGGLAIMPPSGALLQTDQDLILLWIDQGASNN